MGKWMPFSSTVDDLSDRVPCICLIPIQGSGLCDLVYVQDVDGPDLLNAFDDVIERYALADIQCTLELPPVRSSKEVQP